MLLLVLHFCFPKSFINLNPTHKAKETLQHIILKKKLRLCVENITCQKLTTTTFFQILAKFAKFYCSGKVYFTKIVALEKVIIKQCCSWVCNVFEKHKGGHNMGNVEKQFFHVIKFIFSALKLQLKLSPEFFIKKLEFSEIISSRRNLPTEKQVRKKWSLSLRTSSANVTKSAENCRFGHIYWKNH